MQSANYYRKQAALAQRLLKAATQNDLRETLERFVRDYTDIAIDLEGGLISIDHPSLLPQSEHLE